MYEYKSLGCATWGLLASECEHTRLIGINNTYCTLKIRTPFGNFDFALWTVAYPKVRLFRLGGQEVERQVVIKNEQRSSLAVST